jgi:hypothetical protein
VLLQKDQTTVFLDEVVVVFCHQVTLRLIVRSARKQRNNASKANSDRVAKIGTKEAHCLLIGLQYTVPSVETRRALTRQVVDTVIGTANGTGVNGGIGVLAVVATAPSPTSM